VPGRGRPRPGGRAPRPFQKPRSNGCSAAAPNIVAIGKQHDLRVLPLDVGNLILKCHALTMDFEPLTGESQLPLHCGMAAVLDLHPVLLPAAAVRPITVLGDETPGPFGRLRGIGQALSRRARMARR
jgi:hypothetical protein